MQPEPAAFVGAALTDLVRGDLHRYTESDLHHLLAQLDAFVAEAHEVPTATSARQHALLGTAAATLVFTAITARVAARDAVRAAGRAAK